MHNRGYQFSSNTAEIPSLVQFFIDLTNDSNVVSANNVETKYNLFNTSIGKDYAEREKQLNFMSNFVWLFIVQLERC